MAVSTVHPGITSMSHVLLLIWQSHDLVALSLSQRSITALAAVVVGGNTLRYSAGCFPVVPRVDGLGQILDARFSGGCATLASSRASKTTASMHAADKEGRSQLYRESDLAGEAFLDHDRRE
jgi:hypothetical protein